MARPERPDLETELHAFRRLDARTPDGLAKAKAGLARKTGLIVGEAADRLREAGVTGHHDALLRAWAAMNEEPLRRDLGCTGKLAVVRALDDLLWHDPDVFVAAARTIQLEPAWGKPVDTAGPVRRAGLAALLRVRWDGTPSVIGDHLVDDDPHVRAFAASAVAAWGERIGVALLRHKLLTGDKDADVLIDTLAALLDLDRADGLGLAKAWLGDDGGQRREIAALALGQSRLPEAMDLLRGGLDTAVSSDQRRMLFVAIGTLRLPAARDWLLDALAGPDASRALEALRPYRFEPGLVDEARKRVPAKIRAHVDDVLAE